MDDKCFMYKENEGCSGGIFGTTCGQSCPFFKTENQQKEAESRVVERFIEINWPGTYRSCIDGRILYENKGTTTNYYIW